MHLARIDAASLTRFAALCLIVTLSATSAQLGASREKESKLDPQLRKRASLTGYSTVIVRATDKSALKAIRPLIKGTGGTFRRSLPGISSEVAVVPNAALHALAANPSVHSVALDRLVVGAMERSGITVGATAVRKELGYDGEGVGIAVIDSGVASWHDDLAGASGVQRVERFVDFVNGAEQPYDDYGHGTHVAGIIAGNGADSAGARTGIAPAARLIVLKALDASGRGRISDVIAAIEYVIAERDALNIRVLNLSLASGVYTSFTIDPLALATERAVSAGIVVVAAGGNNGASPEGRTRYGGVTSPGNAPWVLTVGGMSHMGTNKNSDDTVAVFSSRGPGAIDHAAKPDVLAPAVGIESLAAPGSTLYSAWPQFLLGGTVEDSAIPVSQSERHEHGGADGVRDRRADDSGESHADAESSEGHPAVHGELEHELRLPDAGCGVPEREGRGGAREASAQSLDHRLSRLLRLEPPHHLGQLLGQEWTPDFRRECLVSGRHVGRRFNADGSDRRMGHRVFHDELRGARWAPGQCRMRG